MRGQPWRAEAIVSPCNQSMIKILSVTISDYLEAHAACVRQTVDDDRCGGWSLAKVAGHVLHGLVHLVAMTEDEPRGQNVLEAAAS